MNRVREGRNPASSRGLRGRAAGVACTRMSHAILFWGVELEPPSWAPSPDFAGDDWLPVAAARLALPEPPASVRPAARPGWTRREVAARSGCTVGTFGVANGEAWQRTYAAIAASVVTVDTGASSRPVELAVGADWPAKLSAFCAALQAPCDRPRWTITVELPEP
jgi:hypothetical protein